MNSALLQMSILVTYSARSTVIQNEFVTLVNLILGSGTASAYMVSSVSLTHWSRHLAY